MLALGALVGGCLVAAGGSTAAELGGVPTISGTPIVGGTLTAQSPGDSPVYQWQRCNPATNDCAGGGKNDPNYTGTGVGGQGVDTYPIPAADAGFFIRVLAKDTSLGTQFVPSAPVGPVAGPAPGSLLAGAAQLGIAPQHGISLLAQPSSGVVKLKLPGQKKFSKMSGIQLIPVNTVINTRKGTVELIAAVGQFAHTDPDSSMEFFDGVFKIKQSEATDAPAIAKLLGKLACGGKKKGGAAAAAAGPVAEAAARRKRRLWGSGSGSYGTRGRGGTGSVVGTTWLTKDTCAGTFWKVTEGTGISVDPKGKKKDVFLGPGDDYFAER